MEERIHLLSQGKIALIGFRGVGKSSVAKRVASQMKYSSLSLDNYITENEKMSIKDIVSQKGWNYFRDLEEKYLFKVSDQKQIVLDTGGGFLEGHDGLFSSVKSALVRNNFYCIYLFLKGELIIERLEKIKGSESRPSLGNSSELEAIYKKREPWYRSISDFTVDTENLNVNQVVDAVYEKVSKINADGIIH